MQKSIAIIKEVQKILGTDEVYLVGGGVRDLVMGNEPKDYDFTTSMLPDEIEAKVAAAGRHVYAIGKKFGTIGFKIAIPHEAEIDPPEYDEVSGRHIIHKHWVEFEYVEVTTFRSEVYTSKSRKPEVQFVPSLDEDLARRDFTMNAMVLKADGKIYDPYCGRLDIHAKQIKTVGMPKDRIQEDPLRMLRAARFAARYGFKIDPNFTGKARQLANRIFDVSVERWVQELDKLLTSWYPLQGIEALEKMGLLERILPELDFVTARAFLENKNNFDPWYSEPDKAWKYLLRDTNVNPKTAKYMAVGICARLKFSNDRTKIVLDK